MTQAELKYCFDHWFTEIRNYITYRCADPELATDLVQEAFVKLWEKGLAFQGDQTRGLLYKMANDAWISHYRKQQSALKFRLRFSFKDQSNATEEQLDYEELKDRYEEALSELTESRRTVFLLSRMEQLTYPEIAQRLGISAKAVEKRMTQALKDLRRKLNYAA